MLRIRKALPAPYFEFEFDDRLYYLTLLDENMQGITGLLLNVFIVLYSSDENMKSIIGSLLLKFHLTLFDENMKGITVSLLLNAFI